MKIRMKDVKNQHQQVLYYLINHNGWVTLKHVINLDWFHKFQTRLGELEDEHGQLVERKWFQFINRFGRKSRFLGYKAIDKKKCIELFNKLKDGHS
jgi:hypothetical protein